MCLNKYIKSNYLHKIDFVIPGLALLEFIDDLNVNIIHHFFIYNVMCLFTRVYKYIKKTIIAQI